MCKKTYTYESNYQVLEVVDSRNVVVDAGREDNISKGDSFIIYSSGSVLIEVIAKYLKENVSIMERNSSPIYSYDVTEGQVTMRNNTSNKTLDAVEKKDKVKHID